MITLGKYWGAVKTLRGIESGSGFHDPYVEVKCKKIIEQWNNQSNFLYRNSPTSK